VRNTKGTPGILEADRRWDPLLCGKLEMFFFNLISKRFFFYFSFNFDCLWPVQVLELLLAVCWPAAGVPCGAAPPSRSLPAASAGRGTVIFKLSAEFVQLFTCTLPSHSLISFPNVKNHGEL